MADNGVESGARVRWPRVGLAIWPGGIVVAMRDRLRRSITAMECSLDSSPGEDGSWPECAEAIEGLLAELDVRGATVDIALLPPLALAKHIRTPPVTPRQIDALVTRNMRRYFLVPFGAPVGRACPTEVQGRRVIGALAGCADERLVESVCRAVEGAGLVPGSVTPGSIALAAGVSAHLRSHTSSVVAWSTSQWTGGMVLVGGRPVRMEDWSRPDDEEIRVRVAEMVAESGAEDSVILETMSDRRAGLASPINAGDDGADASLMDPLILAALGAAHRGHVQPSLFTETRFETIGRSARRRARSLMAAVVVVLTFAAGFHALGLERELSALEDAREALRGSVARALELRSGALAVEDRLAGISRMEGEAARWTPALAALAEVLPRTTYLVSLTTDGLTLQLGGVTTESQSIVPTLEASPYFGEVTLTNVRAVDASVGTAATQFNLSMAIPGPRPDGEVGR